MRRMLLLEKRTTARTYIEASSIILLGPNLPIQLHRMNAMEIR